MGRITIIAAMLFSAGLIAVISGPADAAVKTERGNIIIPSSSSKSSHKLKLKGKNDANRKTGFLYDTTGRKK